MSAVCRSLLLGVVLTLAGYGPSFAISTKSIPSTSMVGASPNPSIYGQSVTLQAAVESAAGLATGQAAFTADGSQSLGSASLAADTFSVVTGGGSHSCGLTSGGAVQCWGRNGHGEIGDGTTEDKPTPRTVIASGATAIAAGSFYTCAVVNGAVECWGNNGQGQLGDGTTNESHVPVATSITSGATAIAAGEIHTCAVVSGAVECWGYNGNGQIGDGTNTDSNVPVATSIASGATAIAAGEIHTCAVVSGAVECWGHNNYGQVSGALGGPRLAPFATIRTRALASIGVSLAGGTHQVVAAYAGDANFATSTSSALAVTVNRATTATALGASANPSVFGQSVTFTATVTVQAPGGGTPAGTVAFNDGATTLGTAALSGGAATLSTAALGIGPHAISASYSGSASFTVSASPGLTEGVSPATTATALSMSTSKSLPGQSVTLTATVTVRAPGAGTPAGTVTFADGATTLGTAALSGGVAAFSTAGLSIGPHTISASYSGSASFTASSAEATVTVDPRAGVETRANTITTNTQDLPAVAGLAGGGFVVVFESNLQDGSGFGIYGQRFSTAGVKAGAAFRVNTTTAKSQTQPAIAGLTGGGFVVAWTSDGEDGSGLGVYGQRFNAAGGRLGGAFRANTVTAGAQSAPSIAALTTGGFVVAWQSGDGSGYGIYAQHYNAAGGRVGGEFRVNTDTIGTQALPSAAGLVGGGFVIAWESSPQDGSGYGIYGQRYSAAGARAGAEFRVNTTIAGNQARPSVAGLKDGGFVVAWESSLEDGSGLGVYDQRYAKTGVKAAPVQFLVNTTTAGDQYQPRIAGFSDTGFVAAWTSRNEDGSGLGVYGQLFSATGAKLNVEFRVNTTVLHDQWQPAVATLVGPNFVVAWTSPDGGSSLGVYAQRFGIHR